MKKDAYYFSHDANAQDDPKMMILIDQLGMEGYGIFWALIEKLRNESDYRLPLETTSSFARRWSTSKEKIDTVILKYGLFVIEDAHFFSLRLRRSMEEKTQRARLSANSRWQNAIALQSNSEGNADGMQNDAIKGKESKEKEKEISLLFSDFWERYNYKVGRKTAEAAFRNLSKKDRLDACAGVERYLKSLRDPQFQKHPTTYLRQRTWEDELPQPKTEIPPKEQDVDGFFDRPKIKLPY